MRVFLGADISLFWPYMMIGLLKTFKKCWIFSNIPEYSWIKSTFSPFFDPNFFVQRCTTTIHTSKDSLWNYASDSIGGVVAERCRKMFFCGQSWKIVYFLLIFGWSFEWMLVKHQINSSSLLTIPSLVPECDFRAFRPHI